MAWRTSPADLEGLPPGVPHIIGNEAAERFSFYGMKAVLAVFMVDYLHLLDGPALNGMSEAAATEKVHWFNFWVYFTPILGALLADGFLGKYRTIIALSLVYCAGHAALAMMGVFGHSSVWLMAGLGLIALGSGGIKPCVSAHVGDQFGERNAHLLPRVFNWFYFSINTGAFVSALLTPWLLEWYGPHWAFGIPGVLMALATLVFWMGRHRFIHVPAARGQLVREFFSADSLLVMLKLLPLYLFVAMFWALFDQTGTRFIFQALDMDLKFMGIEWLPSQLQSLNSIFVLTFIPVFAYVIYPLTDRVWKLSPLRKIGAGLFLMALAFAMAALIQQRIDGGGRPNVGWQISVIALITAAEVMVSIVALEFAYTQAPKRMKSLMMCYYLGSVAIGNLLVAGVNHVIQIPSAVELQWDKAAGSVQDGRRILPGCDGTPGTADDLVVRVVEGRPGELEIPGAAVFGEAADRIEALVAAAGRLPGEDEARKALAGLSDPWGHPIGYDTLNSRSARLISPGPDGVLGSPWDLGILLDHMVEAPEPQASWTDRFHPEKPWLERRKRELGLEAAGSGVTDSPGLMDRRVFSGGQTRLEGAAYFWFFTWLMLGTAIAFLPYALLYRPRTCLQD